MGRTALIVILALTVAFGYIGSSIRGASRTLMASHMSYYDQTNARNLARLGVHRLLRFKDGQALDPSLTHPMKPSTVAFNDGCYMVDSSKSANGDTLKINSVGTFGDVNYTVKTKFLFTPKPFPGINAALAVRAINVGVTFNGNPTIDGNDHYTDGSLKASGTPVAGVATMNKTDSTTFANVGGTDIVGSPRVKVDTTTADPMAYLNTYYSSAPAGNIVTTSSGSPATWGTAANPTIVIFDSPTEVKITGNTTGYGILIVRGSLALGGTMEWNGIVIAAGNSAISFATAKGTPDVIGAIIVAGAPGTTFNMSGNPKFAYSSDAIRNARNIKALAFYKILEWFE
jgi:hypothetical protein